MVGLGGSRLNHPDLQQSRILQDEADVQSLVNLMEDSWINPFRSDQDSLVSLATAAMPPTEIAHDLMNASKVGVLCNNEKAETEDLQRCVHKEGDVQRKGNCPQS